MKKLGIKVILLTAVLLFAASFAVGAYDASVLEKMDIVPGEFQDSELVTRQMFARSVAHIMTSDAEFAKTDTGFLDVMSENPYSGEISYLAKGEIMSGDGSGNFNPEDPILCEQAAKVLVKLIGYDTLAQVRGGYPDGYRAVATSLSLFSGVSTQSGEITVKDLKTMLLNTLKTPVPDSIIYEEGGDYQENLVKDKDNETFAEKYLSIYEYDAEVTKVNLSDYTITVRFYENNNDGSFKEGDSETFAVSKNLEIKSFENAPVTILVQNDENIVDLKLKKGISVKYGVVNSVNNTNDDEPYYTNYLEDLTLLNDDTEYEFSEDFTVKYNETEYQGKIALMDKYVRIITDDEKIMLVETWDLTEGGMLSSADHSSIYYQMGNNEYRLGIGSYSQIYVIIDGESRNKNELKEGMLFSYYLGRNRDTAVIVATEKKMTETLLGISETEKELQLGKITVSYSEPLYVYKDGSYSPVSGNGDLSEVFNREVDVYFDALSNAKYIISSDENASNVILGYLIGTKNEKFGNRTVRIFDIFSGDAPAADYPLKDKVKFEGTLTEEEFLQTAGAGDGSELFEFKLNANGEISSIAEPSKLYGYTEAKTSYSSFIDDGNKLWFSTTEGKRVLLDEVTPMIFIYKENDEFRSKQFLYKDLRGKYSDTFTMRYYGYDNSLDFRFITITGDLKSLRAESTYGLLTECNEGVGEDGETCYYVTIDGVKYVVSEENAKSVGLTNTMYVNYAKQAYVDGGAYIVGGIDLSGGFSTWDGQSYGSFSVVGGNVSVISSKRIVLEDGTDYFFNPGGVFFYEVSGKNVFTKTDRRDLLPGEEVMLFVASSSVRGIVTKKVD